MPNRAPACEMAEMERSSPLIVPRLPSGPTRMSLERAGDGGTAIELAMSPWAADAGLAWRGQACHDYRDGADSGPHPAQSSSPQDSSALCESVPHLPVAHLPSLAQRDAPCQSHW